MANWNVGAGDFLARERGENWSVWEHGSFFLSRESRDSDKSRHKPRVFIGGMGLSLINANPSVPLGFAYKQ